MVNKRESVGFGGQSHAADRGLGLLQMVLSKFWQSVHTSQSHVRAEEGTGRAGVKGGVWTHRNRSISRT